MPDPAALQRLLDVRAIEETLSRYFERIDANDYEGAMAFFTEDVEVEIMTGKRVVGRDRFGRAVGRVLDGYSRTSHHVTNLLVDIDGDTAESVCSVYAYHRMRADDSAWHLWCRIHDRYVREGDRWLITEHVLRGVDSRPDRDDIPREWYPGPLGRIEREPVPRRT